MPEVQWTALTLQIPTGTTDLSLIGGKGVLVGWAVKETTGAAVASFDLLDGQVAGGPKLLLPVTLAANESTRDWPLVWIPFENGVFLDMNAGSIRGVVFVIPQNIINVEGQRFVVSQTEPGYVALT